MGTDASVLLKMQPVQWQAQNPLEMVQHIVSLRDLMDRRKWLEIAHQQAQTEFEHQQQLWRQADEDRARDQAIYQTIQNDPTVLKDPNRLIGMGPRGAAIAKALTDAQTSALTREETAGKVAEQKRKRIEENKNAFLNIMETARNAPDEQTRQAIYLPAVAELRRQNFDLWEQDPTLERLASIGPPKTDEDMNQFMDLVKGPDYTRKYRADQQKTADDIQQAALQRQLTQQQITRAQQQASGTEPIQPYQRAQLEQNKWGSVEGLVSILGDPKSSDADRQRALAGLQRHEDLRKSGAINLSPNQTVQNESKLRDDYIRDTKEYVTIRNAYNKVSQSAKAGTAAGDMALVYGFMKMQDPNSTVREGERADAANAAGVEERVRVIWNKLKSGESLTPDMRADFVARAGELYAQSHADYLKTGQMYEGVARRSNLDPKNVVIDLTPATPTKSGGGSDIPRVGDTFQGSRVKSVTRVK